MRRRPTAHTIPCPICGRGFRKRKGLTEHDRIVHRTAALRRPPASSMEAMA